MEEQNAIVEMTPSFENQAITYSTTNEIIQEMEKKFKDIPEDLSDKENYGFVKDGIKILTKMITATETRRKDNNRKAIDYKARNDEKGNGIKDRLDAIRQPMKCKKVAFDTAEEIKRREEERKEAERQALIETRIDNIRNMVTDNIQSNSNVLRDVLAGLKNDSCEWAEEHLVKVKELSAATVENLTGLLNMKIQSEAAEKAEAEREAKEKERQKKQQVENARIAAENKKQAEELQATKDKLKKDLELIEAEKRKIAKQKQQAEEAERKAAQAKKDAEEKERKRVLRIKAEDEAKERADAQVKVEAEKQAQIKKEEDERQAKEEQRLVAQAKKDTEEKERQRLLNIQAEKEEAVRVERERVAAEKLAAETLLADMTSTAELLATYYCKNSGWAKSLVRDIRENKFKHLKWV
ncbi:MAG: hypothetical protein JJW03_05150 [Desulfosarcina sp.]|nr:hypothetical protein [Desulfobacterales bacterium]